LPTNTLPQSPQYKTPSQTSSQLLILTPARHSVASSLMDVFLLLWTQIFRTQTTSPSVNSLPLTTPSSYRPCPCPSGGATGMAMAHLLYGCMLPWAPPSAIPLSKWLTNQLLHPQPLIFKL